jgi:hypothetical protein
LDLGIGGAITLGSAIPQHYYVVTQLQTQIERFWFSFAVPRRDSTTL